jgi:hypothetical protein
MIRGGPILLGGMVLTDVVKRRWTLTDPTRLGGEEATHVMRSMSRSYREYVRNDWHLMRIEVVNLMILNGMEHLEAGVYMAFIITAIFAVNHMSTRLVGLYYK